MKKIKTWKPPRKLKTNWGGKGTYKPKMNVPVRSK